MIDALFGARAPKPAAAIELPMPPPVLLTLQGGPVFPIVEHLRMYQGLPSLDWQAASAWASAARDDREADAAWHACRSAWLAHLGEALGPAFQVIERDDVALLSALDAREADALIDYVLRTRDRIVGFLAGIAEVTPGSRETVIVFDDEESYYRYVARYYPEEGEFAFSGGMHIAIGCSHFVTVRQALASIEPIIAHELTHACLKHLTLPAWLNEGIAVNSERRLCGKGHLADTPQERHEKHLAFWDEQTLQQFWSGASFLRSDEGNALSYDLAEILVAEMAEDWPAFCRFVSAAELEDAGARAARDHLDVDLGRLMAAMLGREDDRDLTPLPHRWNAPPERGGFRSFTSA